MNSVKWTRPALALVFSTLLWGPAAAQQLFVGLESSTLATRSTDLAGFPEVTWTNHFPFEVNGATATPDGVIYLCNGPFTTRLYSSTLDGPPVLQATVSVDIHGLGYGNGTLYGYSNYASPKGIYEIDPTTGAATLAVSTDAPGFRFFALDFNAEDGLLYGYTEYGVSGLYSIDPGTGEMIRIVGVPPGVNGQGRGMAVGNNTVFLTATRGDDGEPCFAYDLGQGPGGTWVGFTNPYPEWHSTGGAAWIPTPAGVDTGRLDDQRGFRIESVRPNPTTGPVRLALVSDRPAAGQVAVYDLSGARVATLAGGAWTAGRQELVWAGRDDSGRPLPSGVFFLRLESGGRTESARIIRVR